MRNNEISHSGIISAINNKSLIVDIQSTSACGSCSAKSMCGMTDGKIKRIEIQTSNGNENGGKINSEDFHVGQNVEVFMTTSNGTKAIIYGYLYPFIVLIIALAISLYFIKTEWISALISFGAIGLYYISLKLFFNDKIKNEFTFHIRTAN